jgi:signal transduction histidine kinase
VMVLLGSTVISIANVYFINPPLWTGPHVLRIVFFYAVALFYGNVLAEIKRERQRANKGLAWARELEEKVAERTDELRRLYDDAQAANRLKSEFVATVSHELRTPLHIIVGYTALLLEGEYGNLTPEQATTLRLITTQQLALLDLINSVLDVGSLESGKVELELSHVDLPDLLRLLENETRSRWANPNVRFIWKVAPALPRLYTDSGKLKTALTNLIGNAAKFTEHGSITIEAHPRHGGVEILVVDTGIGIPKDKQGLIFEPFRQMDGSMTRRYGGVGLGLYIVRRLLDLIGGEISLESEVGCGSTFRVSLPISNAPPPKAASDGSLVTVAANAP